MHTLEYCLENNMCQIKYKGIIEIYPKRFMNTLLLEQLFNELCESYSLVSITGSWIRAFEKINKK